MKKILYKDLKAELDSYQHLDLWLIAQQRWSMELARKILEREEAYNANKEGYNPNLMDLGLIFLKDVKDFDFKRILDFDRLFFFNKDTQIRFIRDEDDQEYFFMAIQNESCNDMKTLYPLQINDKMKEFRFASLLGSIPAAKIGIKTCAKHQLWRFFHE